jgi:hypothetical protein
LSEKQGDETDRALMLKNTGFVLQCDPGTEHTRIQGKIPETRKSGMTKIKNHADLFEVTDNHQHV